jgi:hypothetical protein
MVNCRRGMTFSPSVALSRQEAESLSVWTHETDPESEVQRKGPVRIRLVRTIPRLGFPKRSLLILQPGLLLVRQDLEVSGVEVSTRSDTPCPSSSPAQSVPLVSRLETALDEPVRNSHPTPDQAPDSYPLLPQAPVSSVTFGRYAVTSRSR